MHVCVNWPVLIKAYSRFPKTYKLYRILRISPDELIRQVTINCAERGLLLYRVRDEIRETLDAYQRLYTSACAYGVRKALMVGMGGQTLYTRNGFL